jgi:hypothetical protein
MSVRFTSLHLSDITVTATPHLTPHLAGTAPLVTLVRAGRCVSVCTVCVITTLCLQYCCCYCCSANAMLPIWSRSDPIYHLTRISDTCVGEDAGTGGTHNRSFDERCINCKFTHSPQETEEFRITKQTRETQGQTADARATAVPATRHCCPANSGPMDPPSGPWATRQTADRDAYHPLHAQRTTSPVRSPQVSGVRCQVSGVRRHVNHQPDHVGYRPAHLSACLLAAGCWLLGLRRATCGRAKGREKRCLLCLSINLIRMRASQVERSGQRRSMIGVGMGMGNRSSSI